MPAKMTYCPRCATPLTTRHEGGRNRIACPDTDCGYMFFGDFSIGCSAVVLRKHNGVQKALLIQRGQEPFAGTWQLPGGYAEHDEPLSTAVEREVEEEAGIIATVRDVVGFPMVTIPGDQVRCCGTVAHIHLFVLAVAMDTLLKREEGAIARLWSMMQDEVFSPIGVLHASLQHSQTADGKSFHSSRFVADSRHPG